MLSIAHKHCLFLVLWGCVCARGLCSAAETANPDLTPQKMNSQAHTSTRERLAIQSILGKGLKPMSEDVVETGEDHYIVHFVEFRDADSAKGIKVDGVTTFDQFDRFANVFIRVDNTIEQRLEAIRKSPNFVWDEFAGHAFAPPALVGAKTVSRGIPAEIVHGGLEKLTGKGVLVVILDTGVDFYNPDFITYDAQGVPSSRLRYFWDTMAESHKPGRFGQPAPVSYPNGRSIGVVYSQEDLNKAIRSTRPLIPTWDVDGHGTACTSIAAGNGNNLGGKYPGVAPDAEIIVVRLGDNLETGYLLNTICGWLDKIAEETPVVISCSFGAMATGHDGLQVEERQLNARFPANTKGRAICICAGNDGGNRMHSEADLANKDKPAKFSWSLGSRGELMVFFSTDEDKDLRFVDPRKMGVKESGEVNLLSHNYVSSFELPPGEGELWFYSDSGKTIHADAYLYSYSGYGDGFDESCTMYNKVIRSPGAASSVITVGSYDWNDQFDQHGVLQSFTDPVKGQPLTIGGLSIYSSTGPLRGSDVLKPEIVAPGQYYFAAASRNVKSTLDSTGAYRLFNGTSAATPYTAGVVALLLQKNPKLTMTEIKDLFKSCGTQDNFTGKLPNPKWGYGKLDVDAVEKMIQKLGQGK